MSIIKYDTQGTINTIAVNLTNSTGSIFSLPKQLSNPSPPASGVSYLYGGDKALEVMQSTGYIGELNFSQQTANRIWYYPDSNGTLLTTIDATTVSNKLFDTSNVFVDTTQPSRVLKFDLSSALPSSSTTLQFEQTVNRTLVFPDANDTIVVENLSQVIMNKKFVTNCSFNDLIDITKLLNIDLHLATTGTQTTLLFNQTANRVLTLPDATDVIVARNTTDQLRNKTLVGPYISDTTDTTKQVSFDISTAQSGFTTILQFTQQASNKTLTFPNITDTIVTRTNTETLQNKTLIQPIISQIQNTGLLTLPTSTDTLVGRQTTDTLTNKTITGTTNTVDANNLRSGSDWVVSLGPATPTTGSVLLYDGSNASWSVNPANYDYLEKSKYTYSSGTVSQTGTTVNGVGTAFLNSMIGGIIVYSNGEEAFITNYTSSTQLTVAQSLSVASSTYIIYYGGLQTDRSGNSSLGNVYNSNLLDGNNVKFVNTLDNSKSVNVDISGATTGAQTTLAFQQSINRILTFPNTTDTIATTAFNQTFTNKTIIGTTNTVDANNLRNGSNWVVGLGPSVPSVGQVLSYDGTYASWVSNPTNYSYLQTASSVYNTGTASQTGTTITGVGTAFTSSMVGGIIVFSGGQESFISSFISTTQLIAVQSQSIGSSTYKIYYGGFQSDTSGYSSLGTVINSALSATSVSFINSTQSLNFNLGGLSNTATTLTFQPTANRILTFPDITDIILTVNSNALITNKQADSSTFRIVDTDTTKYLNFSFNGLTGASMTFNFIQSASRILTFPDATDTLVARTTVDTLTNKNITGTTNTVDANNLRNGSNWVVGLGSASPITGQVLTYDGVYASWQNLPAVNTQYSQFSPSTYSTGTVSQSGNTVSGVGTTFTSSMVGGLVVYASGQEAFITAFISATQLTVAQSLTIASTNYILYYGGFQTDVSGSTSLGVVYNSKFIDSSTTITNIGLNKFAGFTLSSATINTTTTLGFQQTANRSINFQDASGTLAFISQLPDQSVNIGSSPSFASVYFSNSGFTAQIIPPVLSSNINLTLPSTSGTIALTTSIPSNVLVDNADINIPANSIIVGNSGTGLDVKSSGYFINQSVRTTDSPTFAGLTINGNVGATGTLYATTGIISTAGNNIILQPASTKNITAISSNIELVDPSNNNYQLWTNISSGSNLAYIYPINAGTGYIPLYLYNYADSASNVGINIRGSLTLQPQTASNSTLIFKDFTSSNTATIFLSTLGSNISLVLPTSSGTIALTSQIAGLINDSIISSSYVWSSYKDANNLSNVLKQIQAITAPTFTLTSLTTDLSSYYNGYDLCFFSNASLGATQYFCAVNEYITGAITFYNITDQKNPVYISTLASQSGSIGPQTIMTDGSSYIFTAGSSNTQKFASYNVSNMSSPAFVSNITIATASTSDYQGSYFTYGGVNYCFVSGNNDGAVFINVTNPASLSVVYTQGSTKCAGATTLFGTKYVANTTYQLSGFTTSNLQIFDVSALPTPTLTTLNLASYTGTAKCISCQYYSNPSPTIYVGDTQNNRILIVDVSTPTSPSVLTAIGSIGTIGSTGKECAFSGNFVYILAGTSIYYYDMSIRTAPVQVGSLSLGSYGVRSLLMGSLDYLFAPITNNPGGLLSFATPQSGTQVINTLITSNLSALTSLQTPLITSTGNLTLTPASASNLIVNSKTELLKDPANANYQLVKNISSVSGYGMLYAQNSGTGYIPIYLYNTADTASNPTTFIRGSLTLNAQTATNSTLVFNDYSSGFGVSVKTGTLTANRTLILPDADDTFAVLSASQSFTNKLITGTTNTVDANNLRNGSNWVVGLGPTAPSIGQILTYDGTYASWQNNVALKTYAQYSPTTYAVGTASQSGTTITGVGTTFTNAMVGGIIVFASGTESFITAFVSTTQLTASQSQTAGSSSYTIYYGGFQTDNSGNTSMNIVYNAQLLDTLTNIINTTDNTKKLQFALNASTTGTTTTLAFAQTTGRTITFPDATDTVAVLTTAQSFTNKTITGTTNTVDANNLRNGSTWVVSLSGSAPISGNTLTYNGTNAIWSYPTYTQYSPSTYLTGTASQTTTTITGVGTTFTTAMVGGIIVFDSGQEAFIIAFVSTTQLTVAQSQSVSSTTYKIYFGGFQTDTSGNTSMNRVYNAQLINSSTNIVDTGFTKFVGFSLASATSSTSTLLNFVQTTNRTITFPNATDTLVARTTTDTLTNKTLLDTTTIIANNSVVSKQLQFGLSGATASTNTTLAFIQTVNRVLTFPDATDTIAVLSAPQSFTNKNITGTSNTVDANNLRSGGTWVVALDGPSPSAGQLLTFNGGSAVWASPVMLTYAQYSPFVYSAGSAGQSDLIITGESVEFTTAMVGGIIVFDSGQEAFITGYISGTQLIAAQSQSVDNNKYKLYYGGFQTDTSGNTSMNIVYNAQLLDTSTAIVNVADNTKKLKYTLEPAKPNTTTTLVFQQSTNQTMTFPDITDTIVTQSASQLLTNKTMTDNTVFVNVSDTSKQMNFTLASATSSTLTTLAFQQTANRTITFPDITDTLVTLTASQNLTNKLLFDTTCSFVNATTNSKRMTVSLSGATTSTTTNLIFAQTTNRNITFPDASDTVALIATTQTLTNKTINSTTNTVAANNLYNGSTWNIALAGAAPTFGQFLYYNGSQAVWSSVQNSYLTVTSVTYSTGTVSQSAQTVTGVGTTFTSAMVGGIIVYNGGLGKAFITAFVSTTQLTVVQNQTIASTGYTIYFNGFQADSSGSVSMGNVYNASFLDNGGVNFVNATTTSKKMTISLSGASNSTTTTLAFVQTTGRTITFPDATDTLVARATTDTLTNKTLLDTTTAIANATTTTKQLAFSLSGATASTTTTLAFAQTTGRTITFPDATDTLVARATTDTLTNKTLLDTTTAIANTATTTKQLAFLLSGATASTTTTLAFAQTTGRTITFPDATDTLVARATTDTLTNKTLLDTTTAIANASTTTKQLAFSLSGATASTTTTLAFAQSTGRTITFPDATDTVAVLTANQTLTNKTLLDTTTAIANTATTTKQLAFSLSGATASTTTTLAFAQTTGRTLTFPDATDTLVARATTDTLTNKTITGTTNTVDANNLRNGSTWVVSLSGAIPLTNYILSYNGSNAVWSNFNAITTYDAYSPTTYTTGTASQSTTTITGVGTTFTSAMVGGIIQFSGGQQAFITAFVSTTQLTVAQSQTVGSTTYTIYYGGFQTDKSGNTSINILYNAQLLDSSTAIINNTDNTKKLAVSLSGATTATTTTLAFAQTTGRTITFPDATGTVALTSQLPNQAVNTTSSPTFAGLTINGNVGITGTLYASAGIISTSGNNLVLQPDTNKAVMAYTPYFELVDPANTNFQLYSFVTSVGNLACMYALNFGVTYLPLYLYNYTDNGATTNVNVRGSLTLNAQVASNSTLTFVDYSSSFNITLTTGTLTANRALLLPNVTDTLVARTTTDTLTNKTITGTTNNVDANSLRNGSTWVASLSGTAPSPGQVLVYNGANAVWSSSFGTITTYIQYSDMSYTTGTASQTTTTITGVGTTFTTAMVGGIIVFSGGQKAFITAFVSATQLTTSQSQTVGSTTYTIYYGGFQTDQSGNTGIGIVYSGNLLDSYVSFNNSTDITKQLSFSLSGATTGTTTTLAFNQTTGRTITFPNATDTLVARSTTDTLTNKTLLDTTTAIANTATTTKQLAFLLSGATASTTTTLAFNQTTGRTITFPDITDTLVARSTTDTLTNKTLLDTTTAIANTATTTKQLAFLLSGATASTTTTLAFNQTTGRTITFPDITDTLVARSTTDTLTNKTITGTTNTVDANNLRNGSTYVVSLGGSAPVSGNVLVATSSSTATFSQLLPLRPDIFSTGVDGAVTISVNTTLTADTCYSSLTINTGVRLSTAGFKVFVSGTLTLTGTASIGNNGGDGTAGAAGTAAPAGTVGGGAAGGRSAAGGAVTAATQLGGNGGLATGFAGGTSTAPTATNGGVRTMYYLPNALVGRTLANVILSGGCGGAGSTNSSGGGGGGVAVICAQTITGTGTITCNGGAGNIGTGVGAGGGGGGVLVVAYQQLTGGATTANFTANGGALAGTGSANGAAGRVILFPL
jgi:Trk K+ transport system NAD-binding subunit